MRDGTATGVAVIGAGRIGARRARIAAEDPGSTLVGVADAVADRAAKVARELGCRAFAGAEEALRDPEVQAVVVATFNDGLAPLAIAALRAGRHVLCEKPPGRSLAEARAMAEEARLAARRLALGFNHRHTGAVRLAADLSRSGAIGRPLFLRARYGHGARPGYESEWRADPRRAGGGQLLDQGVHLIDLARLMLGEVERAQAVLRTYSWRIGPLEDNAFCLLEHAGGAVSQFHASLSQWKNLFSLELYGETGAVSVEGLGGSYGRERLVWHRRRPESGAPLEEVREFADDMASWREEWRGFLALVADRPRGPGSAPVADAADGVAVMEVVEAIYRAAGCGGPVACSEAAVAGAREEAR